MDTAALVIETLLLQVFEGERYSPRPPRALGRLFMPGKEGQDLPHTYKAPAASRCVTELVRRPW